MTDSHRAPAYNRPADGTHVLGSAQTRKEKGMLLVGLLTELLELARAIIELAREVVALRRERTKGGPRQTDARGAQKERPQAR